MPPSTPSVHLSQTTLGGWTAVWSIASSEMELLIPSEIGPRIIAARVPGGKNLFKEVPDEIGSSGGGGWRIYGGHRLWRAPEERAITYAPDNDPIQIVTHERGITATGAPEPSSHLVKEIDISFYTSSIATITHRITNHGKTSIIVAPWALTVFPESTIGILPLPSRGSHHEQLLPTASLNLWAYTDLTDTRLSFSPTAISVHHDPLKTAPLKIGVGYDGGDQAWSAAVVDKAIFVISFSINPSASYPDRGSMSEIYTDGQILELESLGPLSTLSPGDATTLVEQWSIIPLTPSHFVETPLTTDAMAKVASLANQVVCDHRRVASSRA
jgi:hypothetical protein